MQRPPGDWRRRGCIVVVYFFIHLFNMYVLLYCLFKCIFHYFLLIYMKISPKVVFCSFLIAAWQFCFTQLGIGRGRGTILEPFWDHVGTIFTIFNSLELSFFRFCLPRGIFYLAGDGEGGGRPFQEYFLYFQYHFYMMLQELKYIYIYIQYIRIYINISYIQYIGYY